MKPALSIIVPTHNHTHLLPRLLDSILEQTLDGVEVIIVDDCSDVPCDDVVTAYRNRGMNILLKRYDTNIYTLAARVEGVKAAGADYIGFADADDFFCGHSSLQRILETAQKNNADIVHFYAKGISEKIDLCRMFVPLSHALGGENILSQFLEKDMASVPLWNRIYHRALWQKIIPLAEKTKIKRYLEDNYLSLLLYFYADSYIGVDHVAYTHYCDDRRERSAARAVAAYQIIQELQPYFRQQGCPEAVVTRFVHVMQARIQLFCGWFCTDLVNISDNALFSNELSEKLHGVDSDIFFRALLVGNKLNAQKITACARIILNGN